MSDDGAQLGVTAGRALQSVLGGRDQPTEDERMDPVTMRDWLLEPDHEWTESGDGYTEIARRCAGAILRFYMEDPKRASIPPENVYQQPVDWHHPVILERGLYGVMEEAGLIDDDWGLSGFQWGWAVNAARRCVELPEVPNPALVTFGGEPV